MVWTSTVENKRFDVIKFNTRCEANSDATHCGWEVYFKWAHRVASHRSLLAPLNAIAIALQLESSEKWIADPACAFVSLFRSSLYSSFETVIKIKDMQLPTQGAMQLIWCLSFEAPNALRSLLEGARHSDTLTVSNLPVLNNVGSEHEPQCRTLRGSRIPNRRTPVFLPKLILVAVM
eukprot:3594363-Amphidinium_carterae.1